MRLTAFVLAGAASLIAVAGGVVTGFVLFFLSDLVLALGYSTNLPTILAAWTPACASTLLALAALPAPP